MLIVLITKEKREQPKPVSSNEETFREHNEAVKRFRQSHQDLNVVSARDIVLTDGNLLAPVNEVKPGSNIQN